MAITASGLYGLTLEKFFIDTVGDSLEVETNELALTNDTHTPNFDTHDFADDLTNEISGGNYAREPITSTDITLSAGTLTYDAADTVYDNGGSDDVTITDAMAAFTIIDITTDADSPLFSCHDFVTAASCSNSTFTVQWNASGKVTLDYTP